MQAKYKCEQLSRASENIYTQNGPKDSNQIT